MAPYSDLDLMFLTAAKPVAEDGAAAEAILHVLWDLKLKVGHSLRSIAELIALAKKDMTVRTALSRGAAAVGRGGPVRRGDARASARRSSAGTAAEFVAAKLAERDARHVRMGDSRYVVEPNVKDGKGGLRDLHTLYWIGKYVHGVERPADLVGAGLLTAAEFRQLRARRALLLGGALPPAPGRRRRRGAARLRPSAADRRGDALRRPAGEIGGRAVHAILFPQRQDGRRPDRRCSSPSSTSRLGKKGFRFALPTMRRRPKRLNGFTLDRGRLSMPSRRFPRRGSGAAARAVRAGRARAAGDPPAIAMRAATRDAKLIDASVRDDPRGQRLVHGRADQSRRDPKWCCAG